MQKEKQVNMRESLSIEEYLNKRKKIKEKEYRGVQRKWGTSNGSAANASHELVQLRWNPLLQSYSV